MATTIQQSKSRNRKAPIKTTDQATSKLLLTAGFSELVALNFQIDPKILQRRVPKGLELRFFEGETYVSLVAMVLRRVKVWGLPISVAGGFGELNLRFYVRRPDGDGFQHGACFIKDYVSSSSAAWILGSVFKTSFDKIRMTYDNSGFNSKDPGVVPKVDYRWRVGDHENRIRIRARKQLTKITPDSKVGFILDNHNEYSSRDRNTYEYRAEHPKWTIWDAAQANFTCDVTKLFGREFEKPLSKRPASVFVANGSQVKIYRPTKIA